MSPETYPPDFTDTGLQKAREALSDAQTLHEAGGSTAGIVDRIYYAAFHAARAVLSVRGSLPDDHNHVPAQFAEDVVIAEETSMEDAQFLNQMRAYRKKADFGQEAIDLDVEAKIARADRFIEDMAELC